MAFFKFRKGGEETPPPAQAPESVEAMRTRARHRLIGASILVLIGVIGFPLLFDSQPRPIAVDIPIEIPDKATVKPLPATVQVKPAPDVVTETDAGKPVAPASESRAPAPAPTAKPAIAAPAPAVAPSRASTGAINAPAAPAKPTPKVEPPKPIEKPAEKPAEKPVDKAPARVDDGAKARALLEGKDAPAEAKPASAAAAANRYIVQIGAYSDNAKAHEVRIKLEKAGMKTYAQVVQAKEGKRIRVRVGPFETKLEADKVAEKIRRLDLPAAILEL
jgi:DedD protein